MKKESFRKAYIAMGLLFFILNLGAIGYMILEDYSFTEAFYMTIITIATVGFREVRTLSQQGMWFTSFLIIFSFGIFAYAVTTFTRYALDGVFRNYYKDNKLKRKINRLKNHVVVCGFGRNGRQAAFELMEHDYPIIIIDSDETTIDRAQQIPELLYIHGDATQDEILESVSLDKAKALITTLPVDADNLFVVLSAKEINPNLMIISRASDDHSDLKLKRAGATNVIMPDRIGGQRMAKLVAQPDIVEFLDYIMLQTAENVMLEEISCENMADTFNESSIRELDSANDSGANIIGLKRNDKSFVINPLHEILLSNTDKLFALGTRKQIERLKKIVISGPDK